MQRHFAYLTFEQKHPREPSARRAVMERQWLRPRDVWRYAMMLHHYLIIVVLIIIVAVAIAGFHALKMDYIPTTDQITSFHDTFLVAPKAINGQYANMDVDSIVFSYTTGAPDSMAFWQTVDAAANAASWRCTITENNERHYERFTPKRDQRVFNTAEQVRVSYESSDSKVIVAWVRADSTKAVANFSQTRESSFADAAIWPQFRALAGSTNGVTKR